jgi:hypothetical protein
MELYVYVNYMCYETEWEVQNITALEVTCPEGGFGGAEVACWPLIPKFAGSNPAEAVGFFFVF